MIRHVVMFSLTDTDPAERADALGNIRARLNALVGLIPGLESIIVEPDLGLIDGHRDFVLISDHTNGDALLGYQAHPSHLEAAEFISSLTKPERATVDFVS